MALVMSEEFYTSRSIAPDKLNTKKLGISTALQLRHTPENFGEVMVDKVSGEVAGWNNSVNVIKEGVTYKTSKALTYLCLRYLKILKKRKEIRKMLPIWNKERNNISKRCWQIQDKIVPKKPVVTDNT